MTDPLEELVDTLLYEGYALYPYTPAATKNATPTPFGIVYPPAYADEQERAFAHLALQGLAEAPAEARLTAEVRFLAPSGDRHRAAAQRLELDPATLGDLIAGAAVERELELERAGEDPLRVGARLSAAPESDGLAKVTLLLDNRTPAEPGLDRAGALRGSLISTHPILRLSEGRFLSPLDRGDRCASANTWPVLASPGDDVLLGAAIALPDHPELAPESRGSLFDGTEIEEALLLHVLALSDDERAQIARADPAVRAMVERAAAATPEDLLALHGRMTLRDPVTREPPVPSPDIPDPSRGEQEAVVDGVRYRRGDRVLLRPGPAADLHARMLDGRTATIERIFVDFEDKAYFAVTIDGDPGQELLRQTGRFLFFFPDEVEPLP